MSFTMTPIFLILQLKPLWPKHRFICKLKSDHCKVLLKCLEENHLQIKAEGKSIQKVYDEAFVTDEKLGLQYAFDEELGVLTTRPNTIGCGMQIKAEIHVRNML